MERFRVGIGFVGTVRKGKNANSTMTPRQRPRKEHLQQQIQKKTSPNRNPLPNPSPSAPAVGDSFVLEESDDEGSAASVRTNVNNKRKTSFDDDVDDIVLNEAVYSVRDI